jgi:hypothetical protein
MNKTDAITEILQQAELGKPIKAEHFEAAKLHWRKITKDFDLVRFQNALVMFLSRNDELSCLIDEDFEEEVRLRMEQKDEDAPSPKWKFVSVGEMEFLRRFMLVRNLSGVIFFAQDLPNKIVSVSTESRQMAREMLAVLLLESCYANRRQSCLNFRTNELAEFLYPELKGKLTN